MYSSDSEILRLSKIAGCDKITKGACKTMRNYMRILMNNITYNILCNTHPFNKYEIDINDISFACGSYIQECYNEDGLILNRQNFVNLFYLSLYSRNFNNIDIKIDIITLISFQKYFELCCIEFMRECILKSEKCELKSHSLHYEEIKKSRVNLPIVKIEYDDSIETTNYIINIGKLIFTVIKSKFNGLRITDITVRRFIEIVNIYLSNYKIAFDLFKNNHYGDEDKLLDDEKNNCDFATSKYLFHHFDENFFYTDELLNFNSNNNYKLIYQILIYLIQISNKDNIIDINNCELLNPIFLDSIGFVDVNLKVEDFLHSDNILQVGEDDSIFISDFENDIVKDFQKNFIMYEKNYSKHFELSLLDEFDDMIIKKTDKKRHMRVINKKIISDVNPNLIEKINSILLSVENIGNRHVKFSSKSEKNSTDEIPKNLPYVDMIFSKQPGLSLPPKII